MLRFLAVRNLAVIEALEVEFRPGLNVLTGETGAGKSILVGAIGLLVGGRASPDVIRTGEEQATIQAVFDQAGGPELIVRREISQQGRSRAFINGTLCAAGDLKTLGAALVDLHGQHDHQALLDPLAHLDLLDAYGGARELRDRVRDAYAAFRHVTAALAEARRDERDRASRLELLSFQLGELERAALRPGEDEELAATRQILQSADRLERLCREGYEILYEKDEAVLAGLGGVWRRLAELADMDARFAPYLEARDGIKSHLEDLAAFLRSYAAHLDASPARLQEVEDRLAAVERVKRKYGPTLADALAREAALRGEVRAVETAGARAGTLEAEVDRARAAYLLAAGDLSAWRRELAPRFAHALVEQLGDLALDRTRFEVRFADPLPEGEWTERGLDAAEFYVSPNPGEDLRPLARIASGGEVSRMMLALKTLASTDAPGKTLVFDEVDSGIGGRAAHAVGRKLRDLGRRFQVLCITHLPQIAAYSGTHFHIAKAIRRHRTVTTVTRLEADPRIDELARMLGGIALTERSRASARELIWSCLGESEHITKGESEAPAVGESERAKVKPARRG